MIEYLSIQPVKSFKFKFKKILLPQIHWYTVKCRYNAFSGVQEIDRVIAVTAL